MFTRDFPYDIGTFVRIKENGDCGTISAYHVYHDGITAFVSGFKECWCGEYLLDQIQPLTDEEIKCLEDEKRKQGFVV